MSIIVPPSRDELEGKRAQLREKIDERETSKQIVEVEKEYREGLTSLKDIIAPSAIKFNSADFEINGKLGRSFFVLAYPRYLSTDWLSPIINMDTAMDMSMFVYPIDSADILKKLKSKVGQLSSQMAIESEKGNVRDPVLETAYKDVEFLRDELQQGTEKFFRFALYFTLYAENMEELERMSTLFESTMAAKLMITKRAILQSNAGLNSTLPIFSNEMDVGTNMNTSPLSTTFPFVSADLSNNEGIMYGINRHNNGLIIFDRFKMENANTLVFAKSGAGKSYAVKLEVLRSLMMGIDVIIIDPENEYKHLADAVAGTYLNVSLNSDSRINPFDLPLPIQGEDNADILRSSVINLMGLMNLMLGKLSPTEEAIMDKALWQTYAKKDITEGSDLHNVQPPTMTDLVEI
jgi:conjugal transfer ATP-binding protein TraC